MAYEKICGNCFYASLRYATDKADCILHPVGLTEMYPIVDRQQAGCENFYYKRTGQNRASLKKHPPRKKKKKRRAKKVVKKPSALTKAKARLRLKKKLRFGSAIYKIKQRKIERLFEENNDCTLLELSKKADMPYYNVWCHLYKKYFKVRKYVYKSKKRKATEKRLRAELKLLMKTSYLKRERKRKQNEDNNEKSE